MLFVCYFLFMNFLAEVRLAEQTKYTDSVYGNVIIKYQGEWGSVCNIDDNVASVTCRMMGYVGGVYDMGIYTSADDFIIDGKPRTQLRTWLDGVQCAGDEKSMNDCNSTLQWGLGSCSKDEDIGIKCYGKY